MATDRKPPRAGGPEIPDLDIRAPAARAAAPSPRASGAPSAAGQKSLPAREAAAARPGEVRPAPREPANPQDYFGSGTFDEDHFGGSSAPIGLDTSDDVLPVADPAAYFGSGGVTLGGGDDELDVFEDSRANAQSIASRAPAPVVPSRKWPTGASPDVVGLAIDEVEVRIAADYGEPPASMALAPLYAARVLKRKRELTSRVKELRARLDQAEQERDTLLASITRQLRGKILSTEEGAKLFEPAAALEKVALERREGLANTNQEHGRKAEDFGRQAAGLAREAAANGTEAAALEKKFEALSVTFERAEAKKKRFYIELRGLVDASEKPGAALSPAQSTRVAELESLIAAHKPDHDAAATALEAAKAALRASEQAGERITRTQRDLDRRRYAVEEHFRKQIGARSEGVSTVEAERRRALADVLRGVLAARGRVVDVAKETLDEVERGDQRVLDRVIELEKHIRAVRSYDEPAVRAGVLIAVATLVLLVVAIALSV